MIQGIFRCKESRHGNVSTLKTQDQTRWLAVRYGRGSLISQGPSSLPAILPSSTSGPFVCPEAPPAVGRKGLPPMVTHLRIRTCPLPNCHFYTATTSALACLALKPRPLETSTSSLPLWHFFPAHWKHPGEKRGSTNTGRSCKKNNVKFHFENLTLHVNIVQHKTNSKTEVSLQIDGYRVWGELVNAFIL